MVDVGKYANTWMVWERTYGWKASLDLCNSRGLYTHHHEFCIKGRMTISHLLMTSICFLTFSDFFYGFFGPHGMIITVSNKRPFGSQYVCCTFLSEHRDASWRMSQNHPR